MIKILSAITMLTEHELQQLNAAVAERKWIAPIDPSPLPDADCTPEQREKREWDRGIITVGNKGTKFKINLGTSNQESETFRCELNQKAK